MWQLIISPCVVFANVLGGAVSGEGEKERKGEPEPTGMYYVIVYVHPCTKIFGSLLCLLDVVFIIGEEKEKEEEQAVAGIGFDNGLFEYGTTTPLPTITTDNGLEKGEREYGFGFGTVAVTMLWLKENMNMDLDLVQQHHNTTTQIGFNNDIGVTPAAPAPAVIMLWLNNTNGFK